MQYSPKLKKAMQEIKDILSKHDIAGMVVIHTPGHSEFLNKMDPTYSILKIKGDEVRMRATAADYNGDLAARNKAIADTCNMLHSITATTGQMLMPLMDLSDKVDKILNASHDGPGFTSHTTQNN